MFRQEIINIKKEVSALGTAYSDAANRRDNALDLNEKTQGLAEVAVVLKLLDGLSVPLSSMVKAEYLYTLETLQETLYLAKKALKVNDDASEVLKEIDSLQSKVVHQLLLKQD